MLFGEIIINTERIRASRFTLFIVFLLVSSSSCTASFRSDNSGMSFRVDPWTERSYLSEKYMQTKRPQRFIRLRVSNFSGTNDPVDD